MGTNQKQSNDLLEDVHSMIRKVAYTPPKLRYYGAIKTLTQGGSKNADENGMGSMTSSGSDRNIKSGVVQIGMHPKGFGLYLFDYKPEFKENWGDGRQFGVMADEVETIMPQAVSLHPDGYKVVNYAMLGITRNLH